MILAGRKVELVSFFGDEDWQYAFSLASDHDSRLTHDEMVREALRDGVFFWVGYASGIRAGVAFAKHYRDGLTMDGYTDPKKLTRGRAVWYSLTSAHLMLTYILRFTPTVYARVSRNDLQLHRLCKVLGMKYDHEEKDRIVYSKKRDEYQSFDWDTSDSKECHTAFENTSPVPQTYF